MISGSYAISGLGLVNARLRLKHALLVPHRDLKACTIYNVLTEETDLFFARLQNMARRQYMTLGTGIDLISAIYVFSKRILTYELRYEKTDF